MPEKVPFHVIHVSGQDDGHKAVELNSHSPTTKGWQSSRFCLYPQDMVIQLDKRARMRKIQLLAHQFLIPTKIEFYVGDVAPDKPVSLQNARYTRLGYVSLADNEKTGFRARELKSVHVDAVGVYLKLVIHKNHVNRHNIYNQAGIIAINVIGDIVLNPYDDNYPYIEDNRLKQDPALAGLINKPDHISPLDDLAFDMYQDPEVAQIIRKLEKKKQEAVLKENFDQAKKFKVAITDLQKVGEKLGKFEVEKRQAVENEDYDKAKLKKIQMEEYRVNQYQRLNVPQLLAIAEKTSLDLEPTRQPTPPKLESLKNTPPPPNVPDLDPPPKTPYDDKPLPALKRTDDEEPVTQPPPTVATPPPAAEPSPRKDETGPNRPEHAVEPMSEKDQREASGAIDVFGEELVSKAYSKHWSLREEALLTVMDQLRNMDPGTQKEDVRAMLRQAVFLVRRGIKDKVHGVFKAAVTLLRYILKDFISLHKLGRSEVHYTVEKTLPEMLHKTGETAARMREEAKGFVYEMAQFPDVKIHHFVPHECVKPFLPNTSPRLAQSRTEIVEQLYRDLGLDNSGLTVDNIMKFCVAALQHTNGKVREIAERLIIQLYKDVGAPIKNYLPPDDDKTRKNTLYRQLFEAFDKIDGKPSKEELKRQKAEEEKAKKAEIDALQAQLAQLKEMNKGNIPVDENILKDAGTKGNKTSVKGDKKAPAKKGATKAPPKKTTKPPEDHDDTSTIFNIDNTCIFCGEKDESFTEEGLDLHYWKSCAMLKRCANCKQVVEIAGLTEHYLSECESKDNFSKCPRCTEAIPKTEFDQHVKENSCNAANPPENHCPLCHENFSGGEEGWKVHLMGKDGCRQNPRRLQALNKKQTTATAGKPAAKPKAPSRIPARGKPAAKTPRR